MGASVSKKRLEDWSSEELADALVNDLSDAYATYRDALLKDAVNGGAVAVLLNEDQFNGILDDLGIQRMTHRSRLLYEWKTWKSQQQQQLQQDGKLSYRFRIHCAGRTSIRVRFVFCSV